MNQKYFSNFVCKDFSSFFSAKQKRNLLILDVREEKKFLILSLHTIDVRRMNLRKNEIIISSHPFDRLFEEEEFERGRGGNLFPLTPKKPEVILKQKPPSFGRCCLNAEGQMRSYEEKCLKLINNCGTFALAM